MDRPSMLRRVAETGYNVGFGAKKHFATFDIIQKAPGWIAFISLGIGVFALFYDPLSSKVIGACVVVLGISGLYIAPYDPEKRSYEQIGTKLTQLYNEIRDVYFEVKSLSNNDDFSSHLDKIGVIEQEYYKISLTKQILFSDWYAHYKFFWQHQTEWIDEQKRFKLFRDKLPLSFTIAISILIIGALGIIIAERSIWFCSR
jgi:hypothetical protein